MRPTAWGSLGVVNEQSISTASKTPRTGIGISRLCTRGLAYEEHIICFAFDAAGAGNM